MLNTNTNKKGKVRRVQHEAITQRHFFHYMSTILKKYRPYIFAIPNGGKRNAFEAKMLKLEGTTIGVFDTFFGWPTKKYHGLFLEFKYGTNCLTDAQKTFGILMSDIGYKCCVCYTFDDAIKTIKDYIDDKL